MLHCQKLIFFLNFHILVMNEGIVLKFYVSYLNSTVHFCMNFRKKNSMVIEGKGQRAFQPPVFSSFEPAWATGHRPPG